MITDHTDDAALIRALLASEDFVVFTPDNWQLACEHTGNVTVNSEGQTRCHDCGWLGLA